MMIMIKMIMIMIMFTMIMIMVIVITPMRVDPMQAHSIRQINRQSNPIRGNTIQETMR